ncbi:MAG: hypothetical protein K6G16_08210, partial [Lachnospiraceae bacterium]|nr:hypothetical protein [Lachnospiraceae bacterium]
IPLSGCGVFNVNAANRIKKAPQGGTVKISTNRWLSFHHMVFDALAERPDVTVQVDFLEQGHKGAKKRIVIPAGTDVQSLLDSNGYAGFLYLASKLGTVPVE